MISRIFPDSSSMEMSIHEELNLNFLTIEEIQKQLQKNNIMFFRNVKDINFMKNENGVINKIILSDRKNTIKLNAEICIFQQDLEYSNCDL
jgi:hypothetical protein